MNFLDREERFLVVLIGVLKSNVDHDTFRTKLNVKDTCVLKRQEPGLLGYPKCDVGRLEVNTIDTKAYTSVVFGRVSNLSTEQGTLTHM